MLTNLYVNGFKNLLDVEVSFGPFTCIAGPNGAGKSNLFDAIRFLSALADRPLMDAALSVRDEKNKGGDVRSLFHRVAQRREDRMVFVADMIVPQSGEDDLGQVAEASITFLRYTLELACREEGTDSRYGGLEIVREELKHIAQRDAPKRLPFPHSPSWRKSAIQGARRVPSFISTSHSNDEISIQLHQDGGSRGRPFKVSAGKLPRTVLSAANAAESPTALLARREMQSWRLLQLEPSSLRRPAEFNAPNHLGSDGAFLPSVLYRLAKSASEEEGGEEAVYARIANRLGELIGDVRSIKVDRDERRELLSLVVTGSDLTEHMARSLSDGTLRFLALAVLVNDPQEKGLLCLEEPENGIHPERIPAILHLLQDIACNAFEPVGDDNPLRQVIINTHSPSVVREVPDDSLLVAVPRRLSFKEGIATGVSFAALSDTWRSKDSLLPPVAKGRLLSYLNPIAPSAFEQMPGAEYRKMRRVVERDDLQMLLPFQSGRSQ